MNATLNAKTIMHAIVKLYSGTKREVCRQLNLHRVAKAPCFTMVTDFWSCKVQNTKYLGIRLYFVGIDFRLRQWEWCVPPMTNCATKMACGLVGDKERSKTDMTVLLSKMITTVYPVRHVELMGSLFEDLQLITDSKATQLVQYRSHRFLGLVKVVKRIIESGGR